MSEQSIASARASVMIYDDVGKKWAPSGTSQGLSKVHVYHHPSNHTFRVVGRKLQDHEVVINCAILQGLKYNQATPTFHQWRDNRQVYGLNFTSRDDAEIFCNAMLLALDTLNQQAAQQSGQPYRENQYGTNQYQTTSQTPPQSLYESIGRASGQKLQSGQQPALYQSCLPQQQQQQQPQQPPAPQQQQQQQQQLQIYHQPTLQNGVDDTDATYRNRSEVQEPRRISQASNGGASPQLRQMPATPPAPPAPPPPPGGLTAPHPPGPPGPPAPPPPPGPGSRSPATAGGGSNLTNAIANAKLRKTSRTSDGNSSPSVRPPGGDELISEMQMTLRRRKMRGKVNGNNGDNDDASSPPSNDTERPPWRKSNSNSSSTNSMKLSVNGGGESPKLGRRRFGSSSSNELASMSPAVNGHDMSPDLDRVKQEILDEMRRDLQKMKLEIIDALKMELFAESCAQPPDSCKQFSLRRVYYRFTMQNSVPPGMVFPTSTPSMGGHHLCDAIATGLGEKRSAMDAGILSDDSDEDIAMGMIMPTATSQGISNSKKMPHPNGKKTKGRVKIKMEFIDNKLRRYTTFSKRKTGIMKKAYELSTLTGTQVMLLVASETGHVYTFATRKLQPMITSETGKALIQTCLNSPDVPHGESAENALDQRMSATGFEETDLTYAVVEETANIRDSKHVLFGMSSDGSQSDGYSPAPLAQPTPAHSHPLPNAMPSGGTYSLSNKAIVGPSTGLSMQLPPAAGFTMLAPGQPVQLGAMSSNPPSSTQQTNVPPPLVKVSQSQHQQALNLSTSATQGSSVNPSGAADGTTLSQLTAQQSVALMSGNMMIPITSSTPSTINSLPRTVVYQTAQGLMYAAPTTSLPEGVIFNFQQQDQSGTTGQQAQHYITIPVPVSLSNHQLFNTQHVPSTQTSEIDKKS
ncbi:PREDICTED: uncharacterized protein LOC106806462 [Priapulus caudatus]|uniref:Uncharacterized protein LOC106806462 n=1 Tax=Priapulus caudatus TaxID=37621 RepID=A0ABM1DVB6_PRICU|nr:PREDICTED: uncharacterized protein LOC106806462 [Priapulus caudatus]